MARKNQPSVEKPQKHQETESGATRRSSAGEHEDVESSRTRSRNEPGERGSKDYEEIEESRSRMRNDASDDSDEEELSEEDILDEQVDLDASPEGEGPDA